MSTATNDFLCKTAPTKTSGKYGCFSMKYFADLIVHHLLSPFDVYPISQLSNREIALSPPLLDGV
jgi:hypothetical protein